MTTQSAIERWEAQDEAREQLGRETRERWTNAIRPRRSELTEAILGYRPMTVVDHGTYKVTWDEPCYVLLEFDYVTHRRSTGGVTAEVIVLVDGGVGKSHYQREYLNLLADRSVAAFAASLSKRLPELKVPWAQYLNDAAQWVLAEYRAGEPAVILRDVPEPATAGAPLADPIIAADGSTVIFGDGGSLKSYLALGLAASMHSGVELIPGVAPLGSRRVGFLDWEWSAHVHKRRLARLWPDDDLPDLVYVPCRLPIREERDRLRRIIRDHALEYLVIDSVGLAAGGEPESAEVAVQFFATLRELGLDALLVAHVTKQDAKGSAERPFGSAYWHNSARSTWYAKVQTSGTQTMLGLYHRKSNDGPLHAPLGLVVEFGERTVIRRTDVGDSPELAAMLPIRARMIDLLRGGAIPLHEIANEIGEGIEAVRMAAKRGEGRVFTKVPGPDGVYRWALLGHE
jgi:hypothetical protein